MIGKTNIPMGMQKGETVSILLKTNQSSNEDLNGVKVVVSYNDESHEYAYNGQFSVEIPNGKAYTVSFGELNGYKNPSSVTYTATQGFSRSVEVTYSSEFLTLNVTGTSTPVVTIKKAKEVGVSEKYKVVDYVETNGTQYIDTGFKPNQNTRVVVDFKADNIAQHVWGSRIEWRNNSFLCCWETNFDWCVQINASNFNGGAFDANARHTVEMSCTEFKVDGTTTATYSVDAFQCTNNLLIASVQNSEQSENFVGKYYSFKVYDGNNLVRDYVPVKNSQGVYGLYDKINDTFSSSTGSLAGGSYIYDETIATQTSVSGLHKIAYDTEYMIEASAVEGFTTPEVQYYTANQPSRSVSVDYLLAEERVTVNVSAEGGASVDGNTASVHTSINGLGVYIQDINGRLWNESEWDNSTTPNGIAVVTHECQFVIALEDAESGYWLEESVILDGLPSLDETSAQQDYNGINNTAVLLSSELSSPAAINCNNYTFPDGSKGYLGAAGEWQAVIDNEAKITSALSLCGGKSFTKIGAGVYYWTSTQYNIRSAYVAASEYLGSTLLELGTNEKRTDIHVRAFKSIGSIEKHPITNGKASFSVPYDETYTVSLSDMDGYTASESQTYTASQPTREISMEYKKAVEHVIVNVSSDDNTNMDGYKVYVRPNVANGVYIQDVDGNLYTESEWDTMKVANGIAVVADEYSFVIALEDATSGMPWSAQAWSSSLTTTTYESVAFLDFNGVGNTANMILTEQGSDNAAERCSDYIFSNGKSGYLGAAGEWGIVSTLLTDVNNLLSIAGGNTIPENEIWTSTQYSSARAWTIAASQYSLFSRMVTEYEHSVRAFTELFPSYTITNGKVEFDIPEGVEYTISVEDIGGYTTPEPQSFVAGVGTRTVDMVYEAVKLGVFIQGVSGKLYETASWTSQETANGVAVLTEECSFVIALTDAPDKMQIYARDIGALENYMTAIPNETQAKADYGGATNTTNIMKLQRSTSYAAGWCDAFSFPSGKKGFLPSLGQMWAVYSNKSAVDAALTKAGGTAFVTTYWTSTFWGVNGDYRFCWRLTWSSGTVTQRYLSDSYQVRAFSDL